MKSSIRVFLSYAQQGKSKAGQSKDRGADQKEHQNTLQRINDFLSKSKPELKATYKAASNTEKKEFQNVFSKCGSFDFIDKLKAHAENQAREQDRGPMEN